MTQGATYRLKGFRASLAVRGREMTASTGENVKAIVEKREALPDPTGEAQAKLPVFSVIHVEAGLVADPRAVTSFAETQEGGRGYTVLWFDEDASDEVKHAWVCEAQRKP